MANEKSDYREKDITIFLKQKSCRNKTTGHYKMAKRYDGSKGK